MRLCYRLYTCRKHFCAIANMLDTTILTVVCVLQEGDSALVRAVKGGHTEVTRLLLQHGAKQTVNVSAKLYSTSMCYFTAMASRDHREETRRCGLPWINVMLKWCAFYYSTMRK